MNKTPDNFLRVDELTACSSCGKPCNTIEVNFHTAVHPGACENVLWQDYISALKRP